jgi:glycosyltransferase 2 family protein
MVDLSSYRGVERPQVKPNGRSWLRLAWLAVPLLLWLALRQVPLDQAWAAVSGLSGEQVIVLLAANLAVLLLMALRWWLALRALGHTVPFHRLLGYRLAGFALSFLSPGPQFGGEPLQVYLLHRRQHVPTTIGVASVFLDKLIELLSNFTFLILGVLVAFSIGMLPGTIGGWAVLAGLAVLSLPGGHLLALRLGKRPLTCLITNLQARWDRPIWRTALEHSAQAEDQIALLVKRKPGALAMMGATAGLLWGATLLEFLLMLNFLGAPAGVGQTIGVLTAARLAFLVPAPAGLGTLETGLVLAARAAGFLPAVGLAASLLIHLRDISLALVGLGIGRIASR